MTRPEAPPHEMQIGDYCLGQSITGLAGLTEISPAEYAVLPKTFPREKILRAADITFLGHPWNLVLGTIDGYIYKLSAQFIAEVPERATAAFSDSMTHCSNQFGKPSVTQGKLQTIAKWHTSFGNIFVDTGSALGQYYVNFQVTSGTLVRKAASPLSAIRTFLQWVAAKRRLAPLSSSPPPIPDWAVSGSPPPARTGSAPAHVTMTPATKPPSLSPHASDEVVNTLRSLGTRAWNHREIVNGAFLFCPDIPLIRDEAVLNQALHSLYVHARAWAPGLDIPYHVPQLTIGGQIEDQTAGRFVVDHEGWTKIELSRDFLDIPRAAWLILAHEVCHHILEQSSLANCQSQIANERQTDLLMFVCGYGELVRKGYEVSRQLGSAYVTSHLGYLTPQEHEFAFEWVIAARVANRLGGMKGALPRFPAIVGDFVIENPEITAVRLLNQRIHDAGARNRLIAFYRNKYSYLDLSDLVKMIIDDYERDRR